MTSRSPNRPAGTACSPRHASSSAKPILPASTWSGRSPCSAARCQHPPSAGWTCWQPRPSNDGCGRVASWNAGRTGASEPRAGRHLLSVGPACWCSRLVAAAATVTVGPQPCRAGRSARPHRRTHVSFGIWPYRWAPPLGRRQVPCRGRGRGPGRRPRTICWTQLLADPLARVGDWTTLDARPRSLGSRAGAAASLPDQVLLITRPAGI